MPRIRLRTLIVAVAILALLLGGVRWMAQLSQLRNLYRSRAAAFAQIQSRELGWVAYDEAELSRADLTPAWRRSYSESLVIHRKNVTYCGEMRDKYQRLARYPWLPAAADPPPP